LLQKGKVVVLGENSMTLERCQCGHLRDQHADHVNPLQVVPLAMTEADDEGKPKGLSTNVHGAGKCLVEGCQCAHFATAD
jgi:hypothetical protein